MSKYYCTTAEEFLKERGLYELAIKEITLQGKHLSSKDLAREMKSYTLRGLLDFGMTRQRAPFWMRLDKELKNIIEADNEPYVDIERLEGKITSYKSVLIEWCQKNHTKIKYQVYEDTGNDTLKHFSVKLFINDELVSKGRATSKKKAEEIASKRAYYKNQHRIHD